MAPKHAKPSLEGAHGAAYPSWSTPHPSGQPGPVSSFPSQPREPIAQCSQPSQACHESNPPSRDSNPPTPQPASPNPATPPEASSSKPATQGSERIPDPETSSSLVISSHGGDTVRASGATPRASATKPKRVQTAVFALAPPGGPARRYIAAGTRLAMPLVVDRLGLRILHTPP